MHLYTLKVKNLLSLHHGLQLLLLYLAKDLTQRPFFFLCGIESELCMALHHSGTVVVQGSGLTENILSVMIHWLCVSNEEIDYMWMLAHFIGSLMSIFVCMYVGVCIVVCVCMYVC